MTRWILIGLLVLALLGGVCSRLPGGGSGGGGGKGGLQGCGPINLAPSVITVQEYRDNTLHYTVTKPAAQTDPKVATMYTIVVDIQGPSDYRPSFTIQRQISSLDEAWEVAQEAETQYRRQQAEADARRPKSVAP